MVIPPANSFPWPQNPEFSDVKLMQSQLLIEEIQKLMPRSMKMPVILCGDFNSTPDSGVWEFLQNGYLPASHLGEPSPDHRFCREL